MAKYRSFKVILPSGDIYSTVLNDRQQVVEEADDFLINQRFGADNAESTSAAYATAIAFFFEWCDSIGVDWKDSFRHLGRFVFWLQYYQDGEQIAPASRPKPVRGDRRINGIMAAVRTFLRAQVDNKTLPESVLGALYEGPVDLHSHGSRNSHQRVKARHRRKEDSGTSVDAATKEEVLELIKACRTSRDMFMIIAMWRLGLRRGELVGLRREDIHFARDSSKVGCQASGTHLHVVRRNNPNKAFAKSRRQRIVPADSLVVMAFDLYLLERNLVPKAADNDLLIVNYSARGRGNGIRPDAVNDLLDRLCERGSLDRKINPHMLRHTFATGHMEAGGLLDVLKDLLGHASITSSEVYLTVSEERKRAAVDANPSPRFSLRIEDA